MHLAYGLSVCVLFITYFHPHISSLISVLHAYFVLCFYSVDMRVRARSLCALCLFAYYVMVAFQLFAITIHLSSAKMFEWDESFFFCFATALHFRSIPCSISSIVICSLNFSVLLLLFCCWCTWTAFVWFVDKQWAERWCLFCAILARTRLECWFWAMTTKSDRDMAPHRCSPPMESRNLLYHFSHKSHRLTLPHIIVHLEVFDLWLTCARKKRNYSVSATHLSYSPLNSIVSKSFLCWFKCTAGPANKYEYHVRLRRPRSGHLKKHISRCNRFLFHLLKECFLFRWMRSVLFFFSLLLLFELCYHKRLVGFYVHLSLVSIERHEYNE